MLSQKLSVFLVGLLVILHSNCNAEHVAGRSTQDKNYFKNFEMALFQKIAQNTQSNFIISPYSQKILLGMIMEGAVNETADQIRTALRILSKEEFHPTRIETSNGSDALKIANRIFLDKEYQIKEDYRKNLQQNYLAGVESVEKEKPAETAETINQWVKNGTSGLIPSIIEESDITSDFLMALGNVIYFKGHWKWEFDEALTRNESFYKNDSDCKMQEMMELRYDEYFNYGYIEDLDAEVIDLPYKNGNYSMLIVLPKEQNGIGKLLTNIHCFSIQNLTSHLHWRTINLKIPKFTAEYSTDMVEIFKSLNITRIFSSDAQLDNMVDTGNPLKVSNVLHKSKITVNEIGSEAAAVSFGLVMLTSIVEPIPFIADHPFLYFIKDDMNNMLFAGKYTGP